ncbi:hypothetical protein LJR231_005629 [Phyllobacterium sp. LjRoot231]|uniref:hypothetical protein n=1 Tax=Phyllobacterium sp. LjRoot231 TaxID=3342289 RepID=UPI003ECDAE5F
MDRDHVAPATTALIIIVGTTILSVVGHIAYAEAFSTKRVVAAYGRTRLGIDAVLGVFFTVVALKLPTSRT